jgi:hypothetical protein
LEATALYHLKQEREQRQSFEGDSTELQIKNGLEAPVLKAQGPIHSFFATE